MPKLSIKTDLLAPAASKTIEYVGDNPAQVFSVLPDMMMDTFGFDTGSFWEDHVKWDASSDPASFYAYWRGKNGKDALSTVWVHIEVRGKQSKDKKGEVKIKIKGALSTSFKYKTAIEKSLFWIYSKWFYKKQRLKYIDDANKAIEQLEDTIRSHFELMRRGA